MVHRPVMAWGVLLGIAVLGAGCGRSGPAVNTVNVSGTVSLDGRPLEGVTVVFIGEGAKFVGMGTTGPEGKYQLDRGTIPGKRGAMPGTNQVYFTKPDSSASAEEPPIVPPESNVPVEPQGSPIPPQYSNAAKPALTYEVPEGGTQTADFQLSSR